MFDHFISSCKNYLLFDRTYVMIFLQINLALVVSLLFKRLNWDL